ncbi:MAG: hypothetical protein ACKO23_02930, partial [Gemmataceae bacterium]
MNEIADWEDLFEQVIIQGPSGGTSSLSNQMAFERCNRFPARFEAKAGLIAGQSVESPENDDCR